MKIFKQKCLSLRALDIIILVGALMAYLPAISSATMNNSKEMLELLYLLSSSRSFSQALTSLL